MAGYYFLILVGSIILFQFQFVLCVDIPCPVSNYCFPGTCGIHAGTGCICSDGFKSSSSCTDCCDEAIGSPSFASTSLVFENFQLTQQLATYNQNPTIVNSTTERFYTMYELNAITDISYITFVNLTKGISTEILTKLKNGDSFDCALNQCSLLIQDFKSGLTNVIITYKYIYKDGITVTIPGTAPLPICLGEASNFTEYSSIETPTEVSFECEVKNANYPIPFSRSYGDRVQVIYTAKGGTKTTVFDKVSQITTNRTGVSADGVAIRELLYDYVAPYNCYVNDSVKCRDSPLLVSDSFYTLSHYSTTNRSISISAVSGFTDEYSPVLTYSCIVYELVVAATNFSLGEDLSNEQVIVYFNRTDLPFALTLPAAPGAYSILLQVIDLAGNIRLSRRFVVSDNSSQLQRIPSKLPTSPNSIEQKLTTHNIYWLPVQELPLSYQWKDYYENNDIVTHHWLNPVLSFNNRINRVDSGYDDVVPPMDINGTLNAKGVIEFQYSLMPYENGAFVYNRTEAPSEWGVIPKVQTEYTQAEHGIISGTAWVLWLKAIDIFGHELLDNIVIYTDYTSPLIIDLGLRVGDKVTQYVQKSKDITDLIISFKGIDTESGIRNVHWDIEFRENNSIIASDVVPVDIIPLASCYNSSCYCTVAHLCFRTLYNIKPNPAKFDITQLPHLHTFILKVTITNYANLTVTDSIDIIIDESPPIAGFVSDSEVGQNDINYQSDALLHASWTGFFDRESGVYFYLFGYASKCLTSEDFYLSPNASVELTYSTFTSYTAPAPGIYHVTVVAYNLALGKSTPACSNGITYDVTGPFIRNVDVVHAKIVPGLVKVGTNLSNTEVWLVDENRKRHKLKQGNVTQQCMDTATLIKDVMIFPPFTTKLRNNTVVDDIYLTEEKTIFVCQSVNAYSSLSYLYTVHELSVRWEGEDRESPIHNYEIGVAETESQVEAPDLLSYHSTGTIEHFISHHVNTMEMFYIFIRAINRAMLVTTKVLGPFIVDTTPPVYNQNSPIEVTLHEVYILGNWSNTAFQDTDHPQALFYEVALGTEKGLEDAIPFQYITVVAACTGFCSECVCAGLDSRKLGDFLHSDHTYYLTVRASNGAGLFATGSSHDYTHVAEFPDLGVVIEINPDSTHIDTANFKQIDDIDFQIGTTALACRWHGFKHPHVKVTYKVVIATKPDLAYNITELIPTGQHTSYKFINLQLKDFTEYYVIVIATNVIGSVTAYSDGVTVVPQNASVTHAANVSIGFGCGTDNTNYIQDPSFHELFTNSTNSPWKTVSGKVLANTDEYFVYLSNKTKILQKLTLLQGNFYTLTFSVSQLPNTSDNEVTVTADPMTTRVYVIQENSSMSFQCEFLADFNMVELTIYSRVSGLRLVGVAVRQCVDNVEYQVSTSRTAARWKFEATLDPYIVYYEWAVLHSNGQVIQDYINVGKVSSAQNPHLELKNGHSYYVLVRACSLPISCFQAVSSSPFQVLSDPPVAGSVDAKYSPSKWGGSLVITWERFENTNSTVDLYEWIYGFGSFTIEFALSPWTLITKEELQNLTITRNVTLDPTQFYFVTLKGYNLAGLSTMDTEFVIFNKTLDEDDIYVIDVLPKEYRVLNVEEDWKTPNRAYTNNQTALAAVWPKLKNTNFQYCYTTSATVPTYENCPSGKGETKHNSALITNLHLEQGQKYHFCIYTKNETIAFGDGEPKVIPARSICSNGIVFDNSAPEPGKVYIGFNYGMVSTMYQVSTTDLPVRWEGFVDEEETRGDHHSGIARYEYSIGSTPNGTDVISLLDVGFNTHVIASKLSLVSGLTYYATVRAYDYVGLFTVAISSGITIDTTPPLKGTVTFGYGDLGHSGHRSRITVQANFKGFKDRESGVRDVYWAIGSGQGQADIKGFSEAQELDTGYTEDALTDIRDGETIYVTARVYNNAGLYTQAYSIGTVIDSTPPSKGFVLDGLGSDIDFTKDLHNVSSHWDGFVDPHSEIVEYEWGIGTCETCTDVRAFVSTALVKSAVLESISLATGVKYYSIVRACNRAGLCTTASSDGFLVDISPPIAGVVWDGFSALDQDYQSFRWVVGAHWYGFHDTESGIRNFEWCVGRQPDLCDIRDWMNVYKSEYAFLTLKELPTPTELPLGTIIYSTVRIYNNVGLVSQSSSNGFMIDNTVPYFTKQPTFNLTIGSIVPGTQIYKTYLRIWWESADTISHVISHRVTVHAHVSNVSAIASQNIGNEQQILFSDLRLVDGIRYFARVTACDQSHLCNTSNSDLSILIDTTPPTVGTFAFDTFTLENKLNRTLAGTMVWRNVGPGSEIELAWLGFADPHSGISEYNVIVGSGYTRDDLTGGIVQLKANTTSESEILRATINLVKTLSPFSPGNVVYISIWAFNGVGLRSETNQLSFYVILEADFTDRGELIHQRLNCKIASFYQECTCAALRKACAAVTGNATSEECKPQTSGLYLNISNIVNFHRITEDLNAVVTPSLSLLAASWEFGSRGTESFTRYQITVGLAAGAGSSLFSKQNENMWYDVGKETFASLSLSALNKTLVSNRVYYFYVRAWVDYSTCYIFSSDGIRVDVTPPQLAKKYRATDVISASSATDIDYQTSLDVIRFQWDKVFFEAESALDYFEISLGTTQGGSSLSNGFIRLPYTVTYHEFRGLSLVPGRRYYSTVCAYNTVGFQRCLSTDGVLVDTEKPIVGVVTDGVSQHDLKFQNFTSSLGGRWHGFVDMHSFIRYYEWAIGSAPYKVTNFQFQDVMQWSGAGLNLTMRREGLALIHNTKYFITVRAVDAAGIKSDPVSSNGVLIDTTPPQLMICDQLIFEETFEEFTYRLNDELPVLASNLSILTEPVYDTTPCTCNCSIDQHLVGNLNFSPNCCCACGVISLNTGIQPGIFHTSFIDQQSYLQQLTHCCCSHSVNQFTGAYYTCVCDIEDITESQLGGFVLRGKWEMLNHSLSQTLSESQFISKSGNRSLLLRDTIMSIEFSVEVGVLHTIVFYANYLGVRGDSILKPPKGRVVGAGIDHVFDLNSHVWESNIGYGWRRYAYQFVPRYAVVNFAFEPYDKSYTIVLDSIAVSHCLQQPSSAKGVFLYEEYYTMPNQLQASWVMYDPESAMNLYYWAVGTISGGQQLVPYTLIGNSSHVSAMHLSMQQSTTVYVSAVGVNNAYSSNYTVSAGVVVELTAPVIPGVWDGPAHEDIEYQLQSNVIYMSYETPYDDESGISSCEWAVGESQGATNVLGYMKIPEYRVDKVEAVHSLLADDTKLYSTLRCFNGAGLEAKRSTNGFTIVNQPPKSDQASVTLIYPQYTPFPKRGEFQATAEHVQFYWEGFLDVTGLESYECRIAGKFTAIIEWVNVGLVHQAYFENLQLVDKQIYYIYVRAINRVGLKSMPVYTSFYVDIEPPTLTGYIRTSWDRRGFLDIDWTDTFSHFSDLKYEFIMGSPPGSDSVKSRVSTGLSTMRLSSSEVNQFTLYSITVTAITNSGLTNSLSRLLYPASDS